MKMTAPAEFSSINSDVPETQTLPDVSIAIANPPCGLKKGELAPARPSGLNSETPAGLESATHTSPSASMATPDGEPRPPPT
ncbi:MAG: hypothetical protein ACREQT_11415 [Candidatus Binataceae bacterium]